MRRGVFALTWFLLVSLTLISLYATKATLLNLELKKQSELMDAEELFYQARNFEFDFFKAVSNHNLDEFYNYWDTQGDLNYGYFDYSNLLCEQVSFSFTEFINNQKIQEDSVIFFENSLCVTLSLEDSGFKTFGVVVSPICINTSSQYFSC
ncbi:MAG: hypothetical protein GOU98_04230 [Candidatus Altiarchaeota archaeon]|nr:hypothetical protein [Candidatus Altiarchaeota archaeon]